MNLPDRPSCVAIGIFDGVHRGHQTILRKAVSRARVLHATPVAVTFYPHPLSVLKPGSQPPLLLSIGKRKQEFASCGIRTTVVIPFTKRFSLMSPDHFVKGILVDRLRVLEVVVGHDFGFGRRRRGTTDTLKILGSRFGFRVHVVAPVRVGETRVSSRLIREVIREGDLARARRFLGRPVCVEGKVVRGTGRGKKLGFPTANLTILAGVLPPIGVYAVFATVGDAGGRSGAASSSGGHTFSGMANVGFHPTFKDASSVQYPVSTKRRDALTRDAGRAPLLEVHLFGKSRPLYGRPMEVEFVRRLRDEKRFASADALREQLARDAKRAKKIAAGHLSVHKVFLKNES